MKIKAKFPNSLPRNWKSVGLSGKSREDLNDGKSIEVESIPKGYDQFVDEEASASTSASTGSKNASSKGGK